MAPKKIHLVSNAHLDPVWLWEWEEGAGEALSTFRTVASLCEEFPGFVFNHNEAVLYQWVEDYEPALFKKLRKLVRQKKWHIMGGWFLQPDCNMPNGESFIRQIILGKSYFRQKFGIVPKVAVNLDPFGHSRGLVQILAKSGYSGYLFCRPAQAQRPLPGDEFVWTGYDGSEVLAVRASAHYNSDFGKARSKVEKWMENNPEKELSLLLWGVGDHGGGPSRKDLQDLEDLRKESKDFTICHSTPEDYFQELTKHRAGLPLFSKDLNPWAVGCYTSMVRVKQRHRLLENETYSGEKMASMASFQGLMSYPRMEIQEAVRDLAFSQFHDLLPGSSIPAGEEGALRLLDHGLEIMARVKARAFFALSASQPKAKPGEIPVLILNPHPFRIQTLAECEFEPQEPNWGKGFLIAHVYQNGNLISSQIEREASSLSLDWRKKVVFEACLEPSQINRFDCRLEVIPARPAPLLREADGLIHFENEELDVKINSGTGLIDGYKIRGCDFLRDGAFQPLVLADNADPWGMRVKSFRELTGRFRLASPEVGAFVSGVAAPIPPVRIIEDGAVRSVVESVLSWEHSIVVLRYKLPKRGTEIEVEIRVFWNEKDRMLKLSLPTPFKASKYIGEVVFGRDELPDNGDEAVAQRWVAAISPGEGRAFTVINDGLYGSDFCGGEIRLSLLRSPAYSADTYEDRPAVAQDRFVPRHDQGERLFRVWINGGEMNDRLEKISREALSKNEKPFALPYFPPGTGKKAKPAIVLSDPAIQVVAFKKAEIGPDLVIRLFEPTGQKRQTTLSLPFVPAKKLVTLGAFEVRTLKFKLKTKEFQDVDLLEKPLKKTR